MINFQSRSIPQFPGAQAERPEATGETQGFGGFLETISNQTEEPKGIERIGGFEAGVFGRPQGQGSQSEGESAEDALLNGLFAIPTLPEQQTSLTPGQDLTADGGEGLTRIQSGAGLLADKSATSPKTDPAIATTDPVVGSGKILPGEKTTSGEILPTDLSALAEGEAKNPKSPPLPVQNMTPRQTGPAINENGRGFNIEGLGPLETPPPAITEPPARFQMPTPDASLTNAQQAATLTGTAGQAAAQGLEFTPSTERPVHLNIAETSAPNVIANQTQPAAQPTENQSPAPLVETGKVISQIVEPIRMVSFAKVGTETIKVHLNPPELGRVEVEINSRDTRTHLVEVVLRAERPDTERLLGQHLSELRDAIENRGMTLGDFQFEGREQSNQESELHTDGTDLDLSQGETNTDTIEEANEAPTPRLNRSGQRSELNLVV